jgi:ribosome-binding factor A
MAKQHRRAEDPDAPFTADSLGDGLGPRAQRLEHILFEELDRLFRLEVTDPRLSDLTPASVQLSPDLRNAKVYYALRRPPDTNLASKPPPAKLKIAAKLSAIQEALVRVTPFLRARLADVVSMKRLPDLHFHRDRLAEGALRAAALLHKSPPPPAAPVGEPAAEGPSTSD